MLELKKTINKVIISNHKIDLVPKEENKQRVKEDKQIKEDNSFNQLHSLQLLIQSHSGLKELCKNYFLLIYIIFYSYKRKR